MYKIIFKNGKNICEITYKTTDNGAFFLRGYRRDFSSSDNNKTTVT